MSGVGLLDVNVLVALFDPDHVHHEVAHDWFSDNRPAGWATCPLTENGFVRVVSNAAYGSPVGGPAAVIELFRKFCASKEHQFWPDSVSLNDGDLFNTSRFTSHRHLTDIYLLGLAVKHRGRLVTFDRTIPANAVKGGTDALQVVAPV
ncbi:MAG: PIN domain-containing protein [Acidobacteriota bacterium]|nr:PIN domain-containing protein [Acidobacteriota bacterium]